MCCYHSRPIYAVWWIQSSKKRQSSTILSRWEHHIRDFLAMCVELGTSLGDFCLSSRARRWVISKRNKVKWCKYTLCNLRFYHMENQVNISIANCIFVTVQFWVPLTCLSIFILTWWENSKAISYLHKEKEYLMQGERQKQLLHTMYRYTTVQHYMHMG